MKISLLSCTQSQYTQKIVDLLKKGELYAKGLYADAFKLGRLDPMAKWIEPHACALVQEIISLTEISLPVLSSKQQQGGTFKFLSKYADGLEAESVIIPMKFGNTLCISSQVGCRMGCAFCETGRMGLIRHLTAEEIVAQVFMARFVLEANIRNIVFMGMGEPFDNYDSVMQAISVLTCSSGVGIPPKRITVSTSGRVSEIYRFAREADPSLKLAVSLNAPNDRIRSKIMPVNNEWDLESLKDAMNVYLEHPKREILVEYVLIQGVNDSLDAAKEVADFLHGMKVKVNLIPYNSQSSGRLCSPTEEKMEEFKQFLQGKGYMTLLRKAKGDSIMAACGQLGNKDLKKNLCAKFPISLV